VQLKVQPVLWPAAKRPVACSGHMRHTRAPHSGLPVKPA